MQPQERRAKFTVWATVAVPEPALFRVHNLGAEQSRARALSTAKLALTLISGCTRTAVLDRNEDLVAEYFPDADR